MVYFIKWLKDVRLPSVCYEYVLLPLVKKNATWPMAGQNTVRLEEIYRERMAESRRCHVAAEGEGC